MSANEGRGVPSPPVIKIRHLPTRPLGADAGERRGARELHPDPAGNLSGHETPADGHTKRQVPDVAHLLPGVRVVPQQCNGAEQHGRRPKHDPSVERRFHTENRK